MKRLLGSVLATALVFGAAAARAGEYVFTIKTDKPDAIYAKDEPVTFTIDLAREGRPVAEGQLSCRIGGHIAPAKTETLDLDGKPKTLTVSLGVPGWIYLQVDAKDKDGKAVMTEDRSKKPIPLRGLAGAMVDPLDIKPAVPEPADFDAFWKSQREALDKVPVKAELVEADPPGNAKGKFLCYDVKVDCAGPKPVSGYLTLPKDAKPKSLAAVVSYHGAGVRSAGKPVRGNAISFDVNAHGIENGRDGDFYSELNKGELNNYRHRGATDREEIYFKDMYLRVMRALDYVKTRPEWDGKTLIVLGGSQGGGQALAAAALDKDVTLCLSNVPALGDHHGRKAKRQPGWPRFMDGKWSDADKAKVEETVGYFDNVYFAPRITCETYLSTGFVDTTCSPVSVYAVYNNLPAATKKSIETYPLGGHGNSNGKLGNARIVEILKNLKQ